MKKLFLLLSFFFFIVNHAQVVNDTKESLIVIEKSSKDSGVIISVPNPDEPIAVESENKVFVAVEVQAEPIEGMTKFRQNFADAIKKPKGEVGTLRAMLSFIVEKDGSLTDIRVIRDPGYDMGKQCIRLLRKLGKWKPAINNGKFVRSQFTLPVTIQLDK